MSKKILITGITSFTGCHIARALVQAGNEVIGLTTGKLSDLTPLKSKRLDYSLVTQFVEEAPFGSDNMLSIIAEGTDVFINHGAYKPSHNSPDFDILESVAESTKNLPEVTDYLRRAGCKQFIHTGSYFEAREGTNTDRDVQLAANAYGVAKSLTWELIRHATARQNLPTTKIVIPNPIGPLEDPTRLIPTLVSRWKRRLPLSLSVSLTVGDNIPVSWLAQTYVKSVQAEDLLHTNYLRPSGLVMTWGMLVEELIEKSLKEGYVQHEPDIEYKQGVRKTRANNQLVDSNSLDSKKIFWKSYLDWLWKDVV